MARFLKVYNWVSVALSCLSFTLGSAMGYHPAVSNPEIMQSIDAMKVTVMGTGAKGSEAVVAQMKKEIRSAVQSQMFENGIAAKNDDGNAPANYAVLFRVSADGPKKFRTRAWLELYDVVTHSRSGKKTHAMMWGKEYIVEASSRAKARQELLSKINKATGELLAHHKKAHSDKIA